MNKTEIHVDDFESEFIGLFSAEQLEAIREYFYHLLNAQTSRDGVFPIKAVLDTELWDRAAAWFHEKTYDELWSIDADKWRQKEYACRSASASVSTVQQYLLNATWDDRIGV